MHGVASWVHGSEWRVADGHLPVARVEGGGQEAVAAASVDVDRAVGEHDLPARGAQPQQPAQLVLLCEDRLGCIGACDEREVDLGERHDLERGRRLTTLLEHLVRGRVRVKVGQGQEYGLG